MIGTVYGVKNLLTGRIEKVGSTIQSLARRERNGATAYQKQQWFRSEPYELIALRTVEHFDPEFFWWYLRAIETMEIVRQHTWKSEDGRNSQSPLAQMASGRSLNPTAQGKLGGRPRVRLEQMDWGKWNRLRFTGASDKTIASALGISRRTLKRRIADRLRQDDPV